MPPSTYSAIIGSISSLIRSSRICAGPAGAGEIFAVGACARTANAPSSPTATIAVANIRKWIAGEIVSARQILAFIEALGRCRSCEVPFLPVAALRGVRRRRAEVCDPDFWTNVPAAQVQYHP